MAQIKKYQNAGVINSPSKIKVNIDGRDVELTEEEYDQVLANAYNQIKATGSIGSGDDHVWAQKQALHKDQAKKGLYKYDTSPEQVLRVSYAGPSTSPENLGTNEQGKTKKIT